MTHHLHSLIGLGGAGGEEEEEEEREDWPLSFPRGRGRKRAPLPPMDVWWREAHEPGSVGTHVTCVTCV